MKSRLQIVAIVAFTAVLSLLQPTAAHAAGPSTCDAVAANLVANCGFEAGGGSFSSWTIVHAASDPDLQVLANPHSGTNAAGFGAYAGQNDYIYQNLATTPGHVYDVNFWVNTTQGVGQLSQFVAYWGGLNILTINGGVPGGYIDYNFLLTTTTATTQLEFGGNNETAFNYLDDVVVTDQGVAAAEPSSILLLSINLLGAAVLGLGLKLRKSVAGFHRTAVA